MKIVNIGILAHVDAGKTTVTEGLLYESGAIRNIGRVDNGTTTADSMELEKDRGITIKASSMSFNYKDTKVNIIDTPGHMDFISEVERSIKILDGAILVISAKEGIQVQTQIIFNILKKLSIPTIIFINKIDREGVNLDKLYKEIEDSLDNNIVVMQSVSIKDKDHLEIKNIDEDLNVRTNMEEILLNISEDLAEKYINDLEITTEDYMDIYKKEVLNSNLYPVFHGSALRNIGIKELLDGIIEFMSKDNKLKEELSAYVYKIERDDSLNKKTYIKVSGGRLKVREDVVINNSETTMKIKSLQSLYNGGLVRADEINTGDIGIILNDTNLKIGDFLGEKPLEMQEVIMAEPSLRATVCPKDMSQRSNLIQALFELTEEDPFLDCELIENTDEIILKLFGNIQMEIIRSILESRYGIECIFGELKTIYKERLKRKSEAVVHIEVEPNPYWASIGLIIEPLPIGSGIEYESKISYGYLNSSYQQAVKDGVYKACKEGLHGWEVTDIKITFNYAVYYSPVSTPSDFRDLVPYVFWEAIRKVGTDLIEPYLKYTIEVPSDYCGKVISDVKKMKGTIDGIENKGYETVIMGIVPVDTSKSYQSELISYSEGRGIFLTEPLGYDLSNSEVIKNNLKYKDSKKEALRLLFKKQSEGIL